MARRERYTRRPSTRPLKRMVLVATEGACTERIYFERLKERHRDVVAVLVSPGRAGETSPLRVLERLLAFRRRRATWGAGDSAWLVIDTDQWTTQERAQVARLAHENDVGLAASHPCFEIWLLLHFRSAWAAVTPARLAELLAEDDCFGAYEKKAYAVERTDNLVAAAIGRAQGADTTEPRVWPEPGTTKVYRAVAAILG